MVQSASTGEVSNPQRSQVSREVETRIGRIPYKGRYHKLPRRVEQDYMMTGTVLGKGYNGIVRLAESTFSTSKKRYAVKSFQTKGLCQRKRRQLDAEIEIFLCMDHPHIARLVDVYEATNAVTIVMECADGGELFNRVTQRRFSEDEAAKVTRQVLLALSYIHSHGIVHRDIKLENILYDSKDSNHLKLIDFGFSKFMDSNHRLRTRCGTVAYIAPEVLKKSYTSQCDLWSLGVVVFILLSGHMPFRTSDSDIHDNIIGGYYVMNRQHWRSISYVAQEFTKSLLTVDPCKRLDAKAALRHRWIANSRVVSKTKMDSSVIDALLLWRTAPKFHRACMLLMAWRLTNDDQALVRDYFLALDRNHHGAISFQDFQDVMVNKFHVPEEDVQQVFALLDTTHHQEIHYSDFLAAMVSSRISMTEELLQTTFRHFDTTNSGHVTAEDIRALLGDTFEGEPVETLMAEAHIDIANGTLSYTDFAHHAQACSPSKTNTNTVSFAKRSTPKLWAAVYGASLAGQSPSRRATVKKDTLPALLPKDEPFARCPPSMQLRPSKLAPPICAANLERSTTVVDIDGVTMEFADMRLPCFSNAHDVRGSPCSLGQPMPPRDVALALEAAGRRPTGVARKASNSVVHAKACCSIQ